MIKRLSQPPTNLYTNWIAYSCDLEITFNMKIVMGIYIYRMHFNYGFMDRFAENKLESLKPCRNSIQHVT